jgi:hypothetical protein
MIKKMGSFFGELHGTMFFLILNGFIFLGNFMEQFFSILSKFNYLGTLRNQNVFNLKQVHFLGTFHGTFPILTLVASLNLIYR